MKYTIVFILILTLPTFSFAQKSLDSLTVDAPWREYYDYVSPFENEQAIANVYDKQALLDKDGKEIIPLRYHQVTRFVNNIAWVRFDGGWGAINRKGKVVVPFRYSDANPMKISIWVKNKGKWGLLTWKGKEILPFEYEKPDFKWQYPLTIISKDGKFGVADSIGNIVIPLEWDWCHFAFHNEHFWVQKDGKFGAIDKQNRIVVPCKFDRVEDNDASCYTTFLNKKIGFYFWKTAKEIPNEYLSWNIYSGNVDVMQGEKGYDIYFENGTIFKNQKEAYSSGNFVAIKNEEGKYQLYDKTATLFSNEYFDKPLIFHHFSKYFIVTQNKNQGLLGVDNQMIVPFKYELLISIFNNKENDLFIAKKNNKFGIINIKNEITLPFEYDTLFASWEVNKKVFLIAEKNDKFGIIDIQGKVLLPLEFDLVSLDYRPIFQVFKNGKWTYVHQDFLTIMPNRFYNAVNLLEENSRKINYFVGVNDATFDVFDKQQRLLIEGATWNKNIPYSDYKSNNPVQYVLTKNYVYFCKNGNCGGINHKGDTILPFIYDKISYCGLKHGIKLRKKEQEALYDCIKGKFLSSFSIVKDSMSNSFLVDKFDYSAQDLKQFEENQKRYNASGLVPFQNDSTKLWGVKNLSGKIIVPAVVKFKSNICLHDSMLTFFNAPFYYLVDYQEDTIFKTRDRFNFVGNSIVVFNNNDFTESFILKNRDRVVTTFTLFKPEFDFYDNHLMRVKEIVFIEPESYDDKRFGFFDENGNLVIPFMYENTGKYREGLIAVCKDELWGYINAKNEVIVPLQFAFADDFKNGLAIVQNKEKKYSIINRKGEVLLPFMFDNLERYGERYFKFNGQIINEFGKVIKE